MNLDASTVFVDPIFFDQAMSSDKRLWLEIINQAKSDARSLHRAMQNSLEGKKLVLGMTTQTIEREIKNLKSELNSEWFELVCDFSELNYLSVKSRILAELNGFV